MLDVGATATNPRTGSEWELLELSEKSFVLRSRYERLTRIACFYLSSQEMNEYLDGR